MVKCATYSAFSFTGVNFSFSSLKVSSPVFVHPENTYPSAGVALTGFTSSLSERVNSVSERTPSPSPIRNVILIAAADASVWPASDISAAACVSAGVVTSVEAVSDVSVATAADSEADVSDDSASDVSVEATVSCCSEVVS
nr:hypothetical protein [Porcincola intestinalis]